MTNHSSDSFPRHDGMRGGRKPGSKRDKQRGVSRQLAMGRRGYTVWRATAAEHDKVNRRGRWAG